MEITIDTATTTDLPDILALLDRTQLPQEGLVDHLGAVLVARRDEQVIGCVALEYYCPAALLRSLAVEPAYQGSGLGMRLTQTILALARRCGVQEVYLLTDTAAGFFPRFGFQAIPRADVPAGVRTSVEFAATSPARALVMKARL